MKDTERQGHRMEKTKEPQQLKCKHVIGLDPGTEIRHCWKNDEIRLISMLYLTVSYQF